MRHCVGLTVNALCVACADAFFNHVTRDVAYGGTFDGCGGTGAREGWLGCALTNYTRLTTLDTPFCRTVLCDCCIAHDRSHLQVAPGDGDGDAGAFGRRTVTAHEPRCRAAAGRRAEALP